MDDPFVYPGTEVLRNHFGLRDPAVLQDLETAHSANRMEDLPKIRFTVAGYQKLHRHIFQDVYPWAGKIRATPLAKITENDVVTFLPPRLIEPNLRRAFQELDNGKSLRGLSPDRFAEKAAHTLDEINVIHAFREGNGRTQRALLWRMGEEAGLRIDLSRITREDWIDASIASRETQDHRRMTNVIRGALIGEGLEQSRPKPEPAEKEELDRALAGMRARSSHGRELAAAETNYNRIRDDLSRLDDRMRAGEKLNRDLRNEFARLYSSQDALLKFNTAAAGEGPDAAIATLRSNPQRFGQVAPRYQDRAARQALVDRVAETAPAALQARAEARGLHRSYQKLLAERAVAKQGLSVARKDAEAGNPGEDRDRLLRAWSALPRSMRAEVSPV